MRVLHVAYPIRDERWQSLRCGRLSQLERDDGVRFAHMIHPLVYSYEMEQLLQTSTYLRVPCVGGERVMVSR